MGDARIQGPGGPADRCLRHLPGGVQATALAGLQILHPRPPPGQFRRTISSRKLLAYALNRSLQLSDEALVDKMKTNLAADGYRFRALVETIVLSPQFLDRRMADAARRINVRVRPAPQPKPAQRKLIKTDFRKAN